MRLQEGLMTLSKNLNETDLNLLERCGGVRRWCVKGDDGKSCGGGEYHRGGAVVLLHCRHHQIHLHSYTLRIFPDFA